MNLGETLITAAGAIGGVGGGIFAWVQASAAVGSRKDAQKAQADAEAAQERAEVARDEALELTRESTAAAVRQAAAQEEANRLEIEARRPGIWQGPKYETETTSTWLNVSGQEVTVLSSEVLPNDAAGRVAIVTPRPLPGKVPVGGSLRIMTVKGAGTPPDVLVLQLELDGEPGQKETNIPLS